MTGSENESGWFATGVFDMVARIFPSEIPPFENLLDKKSAGFAIWPTQHIFPVHTKKPFQDIHCGRDELPHSEAAQHFISLFSVFVRSVLQHIEIVHQLPHAYAFEKYMTVYMHHSEHTVEEWRGDVKAFFLTIIAELPGGIFFKKFLKASV